MRTSDWLGWETLSQEHMIVISSEGLVVFSVTLEGRERAHLAVGYSDMELARTVGEEHRGVATKSYRFIFIYIL